MTPINPTFLQGRDAIINVALGSSPGPSQYQDAADVWAGFAARGMGVGASILIQGGITETDTRVIEAFDMPGIMQVPTFTVSDSGGDNDGVAEPGESVVLTVPLTNLAFQPHQLLLRMFGCRIRCLRNHPKHGHDEQAV